MTASLPDKITAIHGALKKAKIAHAFGGALALAYYAEPRSTIDIDLNVFIPPKHYQSLRQALDPLGVAGEVSQESLQRDGQCRLYWDRTALDLFFAYDELHEAMRHATRLVPFGDIKLPILAPEHLVVCKAVFSRPKDWLDIEQVLVCTEDFDIDDVEQWLQRIVGKADQRAKKFTLLANRALKSNSGTQSK